MKYAQNFTYMNVDLAHVEVVAGEALQVTENHEITGFSNRIRIKFFKKKYLKLNMFLTI